MQFDVEAQRQVLAGHWALVERPVLVLAPDASTGIAQQHLDAFFAPEFFLVGAFHALNADVVAAAVIVVGLNVAL